MAKKSTHSIQLPQSPQQYLVWIIRIGQLITNQFNMGLVRYGLTFNQASVLFLLQGAAQRRKDVSLQTLGRMMLLTKPNISRLIEHVEKQKLVKKVASPEDRRVAYVQLTAPGLALVKRLQQQWPLPEVQQLYDVIQRLTPPARQYLNKFFLQIAQAGELQ